MGSACICGSLVMIPKQTTVWACSRCGRQKASRESDLLRAEQDEVSRLRAEVDRLNGAVTDLCNESREVRAALANETRAVERLAERLGEISYPPSVTCNKCDKYHAMMGCTAKTRAACWAAWARQKEVSHD